MRKIILLSAILLSGPAAAAGPLVHGHRGCRALLPENTLAAFAEALRLGVDVLELDMQVTKDDVIVVSHDAEVLPELCLGPDGRRLAAPVLIRSLTLAQVKGFDCGSLPNTRFPKQQARPGERIPALEEVFRLVEASTEPTARSVQFNIETKIVPGKPERAPQPERFAAMVVELVRRHGLERRVILQSFDQRTLLAAKKLAPKLRTSMLTSDNYVDFAAVARSAKADIISPDADWITTESVSALHKTGVQVAPWTVNEPAGWQRLLDMSVDAIITDDPGALIDFLKQKGLRAKSRGLGLNGLKGLKGEKVSRALALLPKDRGQAGAISFEIETGPRAGAHECEVLGRGLTSREPRPGWLPSLIGGVTVYYAPMDAPDGAAVPGIYDLRNITPQDYEIELLDKPEELAGADDILARIKSPGSQPKRYYSGVWKHWYSRLNRAAPIDMVWSEPYQPLSQGAGRPVYERRPATATPEEAARPDKQLSRNPSYYRGPYGRSGWAIHTDQWEDPDRLGAAAYAGRPELADFRFRDTNGCLKVRPACLELLNEFVAEQGRKGRRVQCEVREIDMMPSSR